MTNNNEQLLCRRVSSLPPGRSAPSATTTHIRQQFQRGNVGPLSHNNLLQDVLLPGSFQRRRIWH